ncbi:MAG: diacylglycerol kinase [Treponema sp.]|nr:diacylglycerol kinase [Treponema sp.]
MKENTSGKTLTKLAEFGSIFSEILAHSLVAPGKPLRWTIIANPSAGGFTINKRWKKHRDALNKTLEKARNNPLRSDACPSVFSKTRDNHQQSSEDSKGKLGIYGLVSTTGPGNAAEISKALLQEMAEEKDPFYLFITAGGDGTSLEVLQTLYQAPSALLSRLVIIRLPLGTGNDGAEAWEMEDALKLFINPTGIKTNCGIKLSTVTGKTWPNGEPLLAFNILSVGLDAFVTHMTNKMKGKLPGDSYKLWVDIAALLYDSIYKVDFMEVRGYDEKNAEVINFKEKLLLCAMGISGKRSYGSHKMILPDDRNVCAIKQMPLFRKIMLKNLFSSGGHIGKPESILCNAVRIEITGSHPILAQMDGETVRLEKSDFPIVIELTKPIIPVLKLIQND